MVLAEKTFKLALPHIVQSDSLVWFSQRKENRRKTRVDWLSVKADKGLGDPSVKHWTWPGCISWEQSPKTLSVKLVINFCPKGL